MSIVPDDMAFMKEKTNKMTKNIRKRYLLGPSLLKFSHIHTTNAPPTEYRAPDAPTAIEYGIANPLKRFPEMPPSRIKVTCLALDCISLSMMKPISMRLNVLKKRCLKLLCTKIGVTRRQTWNLWVTA